MSSNLYCVLLIIMWPFRARLIVAPPARGHLEVTFSVFLNSGGSWRFFEQKIYIKSIDRLSNNTYVLEPTFSDILFTGWFNFSLYFLRFCRFNRCYLWFLKVFLLFYFSMHTSRSPAYKRGCSHTLRAPDWLWMRVLSGASRWGPWPFVGNGPIGSP